MDDQERIESDPERATTFDVSESSAGDVSDDSSPYSGALSDDSDDEPVHKRPRVFESVLCTEVAKPPPAGHKQSVREVGGEGARSQRQDDLVARLVRVLEASGYAGRVQVRRLPGHCLVTTLPAAPEQKTLPKGIHRHYNQFRIHTRDPVSGKRTTPPFRTLAEAEAAHAAERAVWKEHKRQKAARPQEEIRAENIARNGNNNKLERDFAHALHKADDKIEVLNDSVQADVCGFFYDESTLALPIQLKVTATHAKGKPNQWEFKDVRGYAGLVVVCFRADQQDGWVYDGAKLDQGPESLKVTPGGKNAKLAINTDDEDTRATPLPLGGIVARLRQLAADRRRFPPHTKEFLSWKFAGKAHSHLKERIGIYLYQMHKDKDRASDFPREQGGSVDLVGGKGERLQFKTGRKFEGHYGLFVNFYEDAGYVDGNRTYRPYHAGVFDWVIVFFFDWKAKEAHWWCIPAFEFKERGYLRTAEQKGKKSFYVYRTAKDCDGNEQWTFDYYKGTLPLGPFPAEAEAAAGPLLDDLRTGRV